MPLSCENMVRLHSCAYRGVRVICVCYVEQCPAAELSVWRGEALSIPQFSVRSPSLHCPLRDPVYAAIRDLGHEVDKTKGGRTSSLLRDRAVSFPFVSRVLAHRHLVVAYFGLQ